MYQPYASYFPYQRPSASASSYQDSIKVRGINLYLLLIKKVAKEFALFIKWYVECNLLCEGVLETRIRMLGMESEKFNEVFIREMELEKCN